MGLPPIQTQTVLSLQTPHPIQIARYARNGLIPNALFETDVANSLNFSIGSRRKELFRYGGDVTSIPASGTTTNRWRFAAHTGPSLRRLWCIFYMARQSSVDSPSASATLYITNIDASTTYGTGTFEWGSTQTASSDVPSEFQQGEVIIGGVPADTDIYGRFEQSSTGRIVSATVFEEAKKLIDSADYILPPGVPVLGPIYDNRRENIYEYATTYWKRGAAQLLNWSVNTDTLITTTGATFKNIVDNSSTTVSASTPGWTIDLRYNKWRTATGVPCVFKCFGKVNVGGGVTGKVKLLDSGGATLATIDVTGTTNAWFSTTVDLPASLAKYDVHYAEPGGNTISLGAVSLYQYQ